MSVPERQNTVQICEGLGELPSDQWDALAGTDNPFVSHAFLHALETEGCLEPYGWHPQHLLVREPDGPLLGACPAYRKTNSYGELVFDWAWASAAQRAGLRYYPKQVIGVPYTPATGPRLLAQDSATKATLLRSVQEAALRHNDSSVHLLFPDDADLAIARQNGWLHRLGTQYHWQNTGYDNFDEFLAGFTARHRKKLKRERRRVVEAQVQCERKTGAEVSEAEWHTWHQLYTDTFDKRGGLPTLSEGFFLRLAETMPEQLLLVLCRHEGKIQAAALNFIGTNTLYGRHWGAFRDFHSLHFEACYYQGIEFAIERGLDRFEPGAQGEYKIQRGFLPTQTWSAHWIAHPGLSAAVEQFVTDERHAMKGLMAELATQSPYRKDREHPGLLPQHSKPLPAKQ